jgi:hypothetical protein
MSDTDDFLTRMKQDAQPPELEADVEDWIRKLYEGDLRTGQRKLMIRYGWLRRLLFDEVKNDADVDDIMSKVLVEYLGPVKTALWAAAAGHLLCSEEDTLMPAIRSIAKNSIALSIRLPVSASMRVCTET